MRVSTLLIRSAVVAVGLGILAPLSSLAQTFAAHTGTSAVISRLPDAGPPRVTVPSHTRRGDNNLIFGRVRDGVYTVDGMVAKLQMNYDVDGANFLYMFVPGVGTAVLSLSAAPDTVSSQAALKGNELSFDAGEHHFKLTGVALATDKGSVPEHLYVRLDRTAWNLNRRPMLGYGNVAALPYAWPGALPGSVAARPADESRLAPPVPAALLPSATAVVPSAPAPAAVSAGALSSVAMQ
jgi:hypothetical protein